MAVEELPESETSFAYILLFPAKHPEKDPAEGSRQCLTGETLHIFAFFTWPVVFRSLPAFLLTDMSVSFPGSVEIVARPVNE